MRGQEDSLLLAAAQEVEREEEEAAAKERESSADKWQAIYAAASDDETGHPWWLTNDNGWCPKCHKHRYAAGMWEGTCFVCEGDLTEVELVRDEYGTRRRHTQQRHWWDEEVYCLNGACHVTAFTPTPMDKRKGKNGVVPCWSCDQDTATSEDLFGKEVRLVSSKMPDIIVERDAHAYAMAVVAECSGEVGGLGYVEKLDNGDLRIYEFCVIEQEASPTGVEFNDDAMHKFLIDNMEREDAENLRLSWHSHANMSTYFSGTDTGDAITKYKKSGTPWLLSLVYNRKGELSTRLDVFDSDVRDQIYLEDLKYLVERPASIAERAKADVKELVHKPPTWAEKKKAEEKTEREKKAAEQKAKASNNGRSRELTVVEGKGPDLSRKPSKNERKRNRRALHARSEFSISEVRDMSWEEVVQCLWYLDYLEQGGNGVVRVGDDLPEDIAGKPINALTEEEWVKYCDAEGIAMDPDTRRMLLATAGDDWGGAV
jgi:proteasome lid subunit RPN8/RPN11